MKLFVYCAGGFGKEIYDTALRANTARPQWDEILFIDDYAQSGSDFYGTRVYTFVDVLDKFSLDAFEVVIANGEPVHRKAIYDKVVAHGVKLGVVADSSAIVSHTAILHPGAILTPHCLAASLAEVGVNAAINAKAIVGHDVRVGAHTVISSMVNIGGACRIGERSYVGMGTQIKEGVTIGNEVIVGMGSVVYQDIPDGMIALGNPARPMRPNVDKLVFKKS
jgi:sugar O-acyltransferase (sialic acid O-acetyltransferase NeuD family)